MTSSDFETWARASTPRLVRLATLLTGSAEEAADVVQDVLMRVYRDWHRISAVEYVDAYVSRMVVNRHLSRARSLSRRDRRERLVAVPEAGPSPSHGVAERIAERDELATALASLGRRQRAIVLLRHVDGVSDEEIAASLGCSTVTVRSQASRALAHLRSALAEGSRP
ncbi:RNA polymerase sigma factor [Mobilicoccus caccae]|uniref:RNA polymerase sigma factor n=1 Tax=Mobilicoccus caccae TaxID=1859295 RepID=UPI0024E103A4|nr:SigE family RNA polymerase sigma factor [Mobilicoccus caccae]